MSLWRRNVVRPTLLFSAAGVMVDAYEEHMFADASPPLVTGRYREIDPPSGAAVSAIQFIHILNETFEQLQVFKLHYYTPVAPSGIFESYLAPVGDDLKMRAVASGVDSLSRDQRRVICTLLVRSDPRAWEASGPFRQMLERQ